MTQCFKEMDKKYRGNLHIWWEGMDIEDSDSVEDVGIMIPDVWFADTQLKVCEAEEEHEMGVYEYRLWETDEDRRHWDANDVFDCEDKEVGLDDSETRGTVWFYDHVAGCRNSEWTHRLW